MKKKQKKIKAVIGIQRGVGFRIRIPRGVKVELRDYDISTLEERGTKTDDQGNRYYEIIFE